MTRSGSSHAERGQATLELAIVMPFVALLLLAVVQVGLLGTRRIAVAAAAREAARVAAITSDTTEIRTAAEDAMPGAARLTVDVDGPRRFGEQISVTVVETVRPTVPLVSAVFPREVTMTARANMTVEVP
ncbi:MAG: pilus assembly protein [Acidimicrobiia bacterium]|nr:pilus assembly protein [Acidimicrobiia bacterium]